MTFWLYWTRNLKLWFKCLMMGFYKSFAKVLKKLSMKHKTIWSLNKLMKSILKKNNNSVFVVRRTGLVFNMGGAMLIWFLVISVLSRTSDGIDIYGGKYFNYLDFFLSIKSWYKVYSMVNKASFFILKSQTI